MSWWGPKGCALFHRRLEHVSSTCTAPHIPTPAIWLPFDTAFLTKVSGKRQLKIWWEAWWEENRSITPETVILLFSLLLQGVLIFPQGKVQVRQRPGAREPRTSSCTPWRLQEPWRVTSLSHFFIYSICPHLLPQITPCPRAWRADEAQKIFLDCTTWPAAGGGQHLLSPLLEKRAALFLAVSHLLDNHFHGTSRPEAEDTQDYI